MREPWHDDMEDDSEEAMGVFRWLVWAGGAGLTIAATVSLYLLF